MFTIMRRCSLVLIILALSFSAQAEGPSVSALKARDVERLLSYAALRSSLQASGGGQAGGGCLFEDADDDGMADSWESGRGLDPADPNDAWFDPDGDHVINLFEFQLESDPHSGATPPTVTVAPNGADFTDVGSAINAVAPGTVIRVAGETYLVNYITFEERVVMIQGGWSADFTQHDLRKFPTTFDGQMIDEILYFSNSTGNPVIILDGIQFINGSGTFGAVNLLAQGTACMKTSMLNCVIRDSESVSFGGVLLMINWDSSQSDRTLANTLIVNNPSSGIYSQMVDTGVGHWRIIHTTISGNTNGGGDNGEGLDAFTLVSAQLTAHIYNSIVWGNDPDACDLEIFGFGGKITFDVDHSDIGVVCTLGDANFNEGEGVVDLDPLFVDPAGADYHLQGASPLVDAGIPLGIPLTDFESDPRNVGAAPDMGADEVQVSCPWDLDGQGTVDMVDFMDLLAAWGTDPGGPPDFDGDGDVGIIDFLELLANWGPCSFFVDCNGNRVWDFIDVQDGTSQDCNGNAVPDECDIADGTSQDCNDNGIPDECEEDCNCNGVADDDDIADGTSTDFNGNGIPDECEAVPPNDNCEDAPLITAGTTPFSTIGATTDGFPQTCDGGAEVFFHNDIWFRYTPECTGEATFSTCNDADFDTRIAVYFDGPCTPINAIACSDNADGCGVTSELTLFVADVITYLVRVGSPSPDENGTGTLTISCEPFGQP